MDDFPVDQLSATGGRIWGTGDDISIEIDLTPIELAQEGEPEERFEGPIRLDRVPLPTSEPGELSGKTFGFPVNPEAGYIDGSVYFLSRHNPVDVTRIVFSDYEGDGITITIEAAFLPEFEGIGYRNFRKVLSCRLKREAPSRG